MRILFLSNSFPNSVNERSGEYNVRLIKQLKGKGNTVIVSFFRMWKPGRKLITRYIHDDIEALQVCLPLIPGEKYFVKRLNIFICRAWGGWLLRREINSCDIIHSVLLCPNGVIASFWAEKFNKLNFSQAIGSDVNFDLKLMVKNHFTKWIKNVNGIISNSKALENEIRNTFPDFHEIKTIYRGIPIDNLVHVLDNYSQKSGIGFLYLGGFGYGDTLKKCLNIKGGATLAMAWQRAEAQLSPLRASLCIGGPGTGKSWLFEWRDKLQYPENVKIIGELSPLAAKEVIRNSDVIVVPSMNEGLPNVLLEGCLYQKVVIGSNAGGIPEVIVDGETGYIFEKGDYISLSALLVMVAKNHGKNPAMGLRAYERVSSYFNAKNYGEQVMDFYNCVMAHKTPRIFKAIQV